MKPSTDQPKAPALKSSDFAAPKAKTRDARPGSKPDAKTDPKEDLKMLPLAEVEKKLGYSANGLSQAEAAKRLTQYGPNELAEKKTNLFLKFLGYFWAHPMDDRHCGDSVGPRSELYVHEKWFVQTADGPRARHRCGRGGQRSMRPRLPRWGECSFVWLTYLTPAAQLTDL